MNLIFNLSWNENLMARLPLSALDLQIYICKILLFFQVFGFLRLTVLVINFWVENMKLEVFYFSASKITVVF